MKSTTKKSLEMIKDTNPDKKNPINPPFLLKNPKQSMQRYSSKKTNYCHGYSGTHV